MLPNLYEAREISDLANLWENTKRLNIAFGDDERTEGDQSCCARAEEGTDAVEGEGINVPSEVRFCKAKPHGDKPREPETRVDHWKAKLWLDASNIDGDGNASLEPGDYQ